MSELIFDAGSITLTANQMWSLELLGDHQGFYETRDYAIEKALNLLAEKRELEEDERSLIVSIDSMEEALDIAEKLCDKANSAEEGSDLKGEEDELNKLYKLLENMDSWVGG
jgi:alkyl sulfatase BDS1-like metallo-beta-lactamase superfamily hydrolase